MCSRRRIVGLLLVNLVLGIVAVSASSPVHINGLDGVQLAGSNSESAVTMCQTTSATTHQQQDAFSSCESGLPTHQPQPASAYTSQRAASMTSPGMSFGGTHTPIRSAGRQPASAKIRPLQQSHSALLDTPAEKIAKLQALYDEPPPPQESKSMRTARPKGGKQPSPVALAFNSSNVHELPPTSINLQYIHHFLNDTECDYFIQLGKTLGLTLSPVLLDNGGIAYENMRTSSTAFVPTHYNDFVRSIEKRVVDIVGGTMDQIGLIQIVEYQPGQKFEPHYDGNAVLPWHYTIFIYLNDIPYRAGGETDFPDLAMRFQPEKGNALFWENMCPRKNRRPQSRHQGIPPRGHTKYGLNFWIKH